MVTLRIGTIASLVFPLLVAGAAWGDEPQLAGQGAVAHPAAKQSDFQEAQRRYKRGIELFNSGVYDAAMIEFRRAYELAPSYKILYNIAQLNRQMDDFASAVGAYERYLRDGGTDVPSARVSEVKAELEKLRPWIGKLEVSSSLPDTEIAVDDRVMGRTPIQAIPVNAGRRRVVAHVPGRPQQSRVIDVAGGETAKLLFEFVDAPDSSQPKPPGSTSVRSPTAASSHAVPAASGQPSGQQPHAIGSRHSPPWLLWGGAALLAVGAAGTGLLAVGASNDIEELKRNPGASGTAYDDTHSRMIGYSVASDVLSGLALATGAVALYFTVKPTRVDSGVGLGFSPTGVRIRGSF